MKSFFTVFCFLMLFMAATFTTSFAQTDWTKYEGNPVLSPGPTGAWDDELVAFPTVFFDGSTYQMWYCNYNQRAASIGYATSSDGITWQKYDDPATVDVLYAESDPVLRTGPSGSYDDYGVSHPCVLMINNIYHMWYAGDSEPASNTGTSICHATSQDGIVWVKDTQNPVLDVGSNGTWDDTWVNTPNVVFDGSIYHLWYCAWNGNWPPDRVRIGHATSPHPDSIWTKDPNNPVLDIGSLGGWDYDRVEAPSVIYDGSLFHMWYSGGVVYHWRVGYATSQDGSQWEKYANNPVLDWGEVGSFDASSVCYCSVLLDTDNNLFKMWYLGAIAPDNGKIGYATAPVPVPQNNWTKHPDPVLEKGSAGEWDDDNVVAPNVIKVGETYHMWYDGNYDNPGTMNNGIGHATSSNGIDWSKDTLNPVLLPTAGSWDLAGVTQASVLFDDMDSLFHMWYGGWSSLNDGSIGHAISTDGGHWTKDSNPVLNPGSPGSWDDFALIAVCVIKVGGNYNMWYDGWADGNSTTLKKIGHATSADGITWEKDANNPVLIPGSSGSWDYNWVRAGKVVFAGTQFHMWYTGGTWPHYDIGYASSYDGSNWTKYNDPDTNDPLYADSDPVMKRGLTGNWDSWSLFSCSVMLNETIDTLKMWYSGSDNDFIDTRIGYATATYAPIDIVNFAFSEIPEGNVLSQNYPNPFNPTTKIEFTIPKSEFVTLKVYNILGQEIATIVSGKLLAGNYNYLWNAGSLASGVYIYKLHTTNFIQVRKMVYMK